MSSSPVPAAVTAASTVGLVRVLGRAQQYEWGKVGAASAVGQLLAAGAESESESASAAAPGGQINNEPFALDPSAHYAELWLGTHPSGPSAVRLADGSTAPLADYLGSSLPFLFKVLSVGAALSVQAHPDAALAAKLHSSRPSVYRDPHHKPELACAITKFEAMCAFRPLREVARHAEDFPELMAIIGPELAQRLRAQAESTASAGRPANIDQPNSAEQKALLREIFAAVMEPPAELLQQQLAAMLDRLQREGVTASVPSECADGGGAGAAAGESASSSASESASAPSSSPSSATSLPVGPLILRLASQYPGDVGLFAPLLLNCFSLPVGASLFLGPNEPHAYLSGDCVECMACSDNVVRAGLTPKLRDTKVLIDMLSYESRSVRDTIMRPVHIAPAVIEFAPPKEFAEFRLLRAEIGDGKAARAAELAALTGPALLLVFDGRGRAETQTQTHTRTAGGATQAHSQPLRRGDVFLVPAGAAVRLEADDKSTLLAFLCAANHQ